MSKSKVPSVVTPNPDLIILLTPGGRKGRVFDSEGRLVFVGNREAVKNFVSGFEAGKVKESSDDK